MKKYVEQSPMHFGKEKKHIVNLLYGSDFKESNQQELALCKWIKNC